MDCGAPKARLVRLDARPHHCKARSESNRFSTLCWDYLVRASDDLAEQTDRRLLAALRVKLRWPNRPHRGRRFAFVVETLLQHGDRGRDSGNPISDIE